MASAELVLVGNGAPIRRNQRRWFVAKFFTAVSAAQFPSKHVIPGNPGHSRTSAFTPT